MGGEPSSSRGRVVDLERIGDALRGRFTIGEPLSWGQSIAYFAGEADIGRIAVAALPVTASREDGTADAFHEAAFELVELSGRGLPTVYRHGVVGGVPYFAYRMPRGRALADRIAEGPFTSRMVLRVAESLLEAIACVHRHGLAHGEINPRNVLVEERGEKVLVTLIGAGLAQISAELRAQTEIRASGFAPALSSYLAPERIAGGAPTVASDLYALGALLHHMVCGRPPTGFDSVEAYADLPSLVEVVRRAREPDPSDRYDGAASMRAAIDWVEIESERHQAHTQDIPLWMELSVVANIPVPELLRGKSSPPSQPPPRPSEPPRSRYGSVPMPSAARTSDASTRSSGSFAIPPAPPLPSIAEPRGSSASDDIEIDLGDDDATPVTRIVASSAPPPALDVPVVPVILDAPPTRTPIWRVVALASLLVVCVAAFVALFVVD